MIAGLNAVTVVFWIFAALALVSGVLCVSRRSPVASALWLVVTMFSLAVLFVLLDAQFLAVMQVLVYAGAIMVLFLFVIMLLNIGRGAGQDRKGVVGLTVGVVLAAVLFVQLKFLRQAAPPSLIRLPDGMMAQMQQHQGLVAEHPVQSPAIGVVHPVEAAFAELIHPSMLAPVLGAQEPGAHHGGGGEREH